MKTQKLRVIWLWVFYFQFWFWKNKVELYGPVTNGAKRFQGASLYSPKPSPDQIELWKKS
jgi:hypothetical protein